MSTNSKEVQVMANGFTAMNSYANCCAASAAACTSARIARNMDTVILAVSIIIVRLVLVQSV